MTTKYLKSLFQLTWFCGAKIKAETGAHFPWHNIYVMQRLATASIKCMCKVANYAAVIYFDIRLHKFRTKQCRCVGGLLINVEYKSWKSGTCAKVTSSKEAFSSSFAVKYRWSVHITLYSSSCIVPLQQLFVLFLSMSVKCRILKSISATVGRCCK